jgi:hypothetical protein
MTLSVSKSNFGRERAGFFDSPPFLVVRSDCEDAGGHSAGLEKNSAASQLVLVIDAGLVTIKETRKDDKKTSSEERFPGV